MPKILGLISLFVLLALPAAAQTTIRVKCGGPRYTDSKGQIWQADYGYSGGTPSNIMTLIKGTPDPVLYQDGRYNTNRQAGMVYSFNVPDGLYHVNLYFAETSDPYQETGARVFNVKVQGATAFSNLDIFAEAGADAPLIKGTDVTVTNGTMRLEFDDVVQNAKVDAIEILPGTSGPQLSIDFKYPDGSAVVGALNYTVSSSLLTLHGSAPLINGQASCALLANPSALGISAQFTINATLTDSAGHVLWQLSLGMNPSEINLATVQNSSLTVVVQKL